MGEMRSSLLVSLTLVAVLAATASASASSSPRLVATVKTAVAHNPYPRAGAVVTVTFTVGEPNKPPGSGVPNGSVFDVQLTRTKGLPTSLTKATRLNGQYHATIRWPGGHILRIKIGGFLNAVPSTAQSGFWLPVTVLKKNF
jgi:hypothetical protein